MSDFATWIGRAAIAITCLTFIVLFGAWVFYPAILTNTEVIALTTGTRIVIVISFFICTLVAFFVGFWALVED